MKTSGGRKIGQYAELRREVRRELARGISRVRQAASRIMVKTYWRIGRYVHEHILEHQERADYSRSVIEKLARDVGLSRTELYYSLEFFRTYPIVPYTGQLTWSHFRELLAVNEPGLRAKFEKQTVRNGWNSIELRVAIKKHRGRKKPATWSKLVPRRGNLHYYRLIAEEDPAKAGVLLDLGFAVNLEWSGRKRRQFRAGDIVEALKGSAGGYRYKKHPEATLKDLFTYRVKNLKAIDGDTFRAKIDLDFGVWIRQKLRLRGLDAPEIETPEGKAAKRYVQKMIRKSKTVIVTTSKSDKYDRYVSDLYCDGLFLNQTLLDEGFARPHLR